MVVVWGWGRSVSTHNFTDMCPKLYYSDVNLDFKNIWKYLMLHFIWNHRNNRPVKLMHWSHIRNYSEELTKCVYKVWNAHIDSKQNESNNSATVKCGWWRPCPSAIHPKYVNPITDKLRCDIWLTPSTVWEILHKELDNGHRWYFIWISFKLETHNPKFLGAFRWWIFQNMNCISPWCS